MLGEVHLRSLSTTGAFAVIVCAGMCQLTRYWVATRNTREESALANSKRRFVERMWNLVIQDHDIDSDLIKDLGLPDDCGIYSVESSVNGQTLYLRRASNGGFEWSIEKLVWLPTTKLRKERIGIDHQILIRRLEAERLLTRIDSYSAAERNASITHPPELDLPHALKNPDSIRGDVNVPQEFRCPLGSGVMSQPVVAPSGLTYDRAVIEQWISRFSTDPATGAPLQMNQLYPNLVIRDMIQAWIVKNVKVLDPILVQRVTRDCSPVASLLSAPDAFFSGPDRTPGGSDQACSAFTTLSAQSSSAVDSNCQEPVSLMTPTETFPHTASKFDRNPNRDSSPESGVGRLSIATNLDSTPGEERFSFQGLSKTPVHSNCSSLKGVDLLTGSKRRMSGVLDSTLPESERQFCLNEGVIASAGFQSSASFEHDFELIERIARFRIGDDTALNTVDAFKMGKSVRMSQLGQSALTPGFKSPLSWNGDDELQSGSVFKFSSMQDSK